jgi:type IV pilus assembly protein PilE
MRVRVRSSGEQLRRNVAGVTLLELLVTVGIVGILAAVAYPSYLQYVIRSNRSIAKSALLQVADRQEQFFADNKRYAADLTQLRYPANGFMVNNDGTPVAAAAADRLYAISLTNTSATTFTVNAAPQLQQATKDTLCQTLTLTHTGRRGQTGASTDCW